MKRYLIAAATAVLVLSMVNADDTGRAYIRTADTAPATPAAPTIAMAGPVTGMITGAGCSNGIGNTCSCGQGETDHRFGLHPIFSRLFWWKKAKCRRCGGLFGPRVNSGNGFGGHGGGEAFNPYPNGVPGTLVFPQHPFVRSPRDFWMADPK